MNEKIRIGVCTLVLFFGVGTAANGLAQTVQRGPYLQMATPTGLTVRWRTDQSVDGVVRYGTTPGSLSQSAVGTTGTEHEVELFGLLPDTRYYYSIGTSSGPLAGDSTYAFVTGPQTGVARATRVWVVGDSGEANSAARAVRDAYMSFTGARGTDMWLMLGDNAYSDGTDTEYQAAVFDTYPELLRQAPVWPTLGNHDGQSASSASQSGPYYDILRERCAEFRVESAALLSGSTGCCCGLDLLVADRAVVLGRGLLGVEDRAGRVGLLPVTGVGGLRVRTAVGTKQGLRGLF